MHFNIGDYERRDRHRVCDLRELPRKQQANPGSWRRNNTSTVIHRQPCCSHSQSYHHTSSKHQYQCLNYIQHLTDALQAEGSAVDAKTYINDTYTTKFHGLSNEQRLMVISQYIRWPKPVDGANAKKLRSSEYDKKDGKGYQLYLHGYYGFESFRICCDFLQFLFGIGRTQRRTIFTKIWISRRRGLLLPQWDIDGPVSVRPQNDWLNRMQTHVARNWPIIKAHYINVPDGGQSNKCYVDHHGEEPDFYDFFWEWISEDQPEAYAYFIAKQRHDLWRQYDGLPSTEPDVPDECKPYPSAQWAVYVFRKTFDVGIKRVGKDICPIHSAIQSTISRLQDVQPTPTTEIGKLQHRIKLHQQRADDIYDMVHYSKNQCSSKLWGDNGWAMNLDEKHMVHSERVIHIEFDYDHSRPEVSLREQDAHYKSRTVLHAMSVVHKPMGRASYMWSELHGGKNSDGIITSLLSIMDKMSFGAGHLVLSSDGASTQVNQFVVMFLHWACSKWNPQRYFKSITWMLYVSGHNYMEADNVGHQLDKLTKRVQSIFTVDDRVQYLKRKLPSDLLVFVLKSLKSNPPEFTEIYKLYTNWFDQEFNKKLRLKYDKPACIQFGQHTVWDEDRGEFTVAVDCDDILVRQSTDWRIQPRTVKIMRDFDKNGYDWAKVQWGKSTIPPIKKAKVEDTLDLIKKFGGVRTDELIAYYDCDNVDDNDDEDDDDEPEADPMDYYYAMIDTNEVWQTMLETGEQQTLPQYPAYKLKKKRKGDSDQVQNSNRKRRKLSK